MGPYYYGVTCVNALLWTDQPVTKPCPFIFHRYDGKKTVTVIVDWPTDFDTLDKSQIELECTETGDSSELLGVLLSAHRGDCTHVLQVTDLLYPIASASFKIKTETRHIVVKLKKAEVKSWYSLRKE